MKKTKINLAQPTVDTETGKILWDSIGTLYIQGEIPPKTKIWGHLHSGVKFGGIIDSSKSDPKPSTNPFDSQSEDTFKIPDTFEVSNEDIEALDNDTTFSDSFMDNLGAFIIEELLRDDTDKIED